MSKPTNFNIPDSLRVVWAALHEYRDELIPEGGLVNDDEMAAENEVLWDDIATAMAWLTESLGYEISTRDDSTNGEYVPLRKETQYRNCLDDVIDSADGMPQLAHQIQYSISTPELRELIDYLESLYEPLED